MPQTEIYFSFEYGWPLVKMPTTKVVENIQIFLHAKFHIFLRFPTISPTFILSCWFIQLESI
jgi:hypothetical protein